MLENDGEDHFVQRSGKGRNITKRQRGQKYLGYNNKKEG
jgi:hypothetical protein